MRRRHQPSPEYVKELCEAVGRVIVSFAICEHALTISTAKIFGLTRVQERALVRPIGLRAKTSLLRRVGKDCLIPGNYKTLNEILKEVEDLSDDRNNLAHGFYGTKNGKFTLVTFSGEARISSRPVAWTPTTLTQLAGSIQQATTRAANLRLLFPKSLKLPKIRSPKS
ncbi:MAG: hypothetical protein Q7T45_08080 [Bradyrhizobium sp.]|uniref:hypothetical protein n=1 Tax=Bradyrhizobium sp. TaxID=376 RepID=UPI00272852AC|nr:hypothetical protein [Bradyrhizobium sp.]MDO8397763.1 hypothetical protein [Bradyrhizobium sp.]